MPKIKKLNRESVPSAAPIAAGIRETPTQPETGPLKASVASWPVPTILAKKVDFIVPAVKEPHRAPKPSKKMKRRHEKTRGAEARLVRRPGAEIFTGDVPMPRLGGKLLSGEGFIEIHWHLVVDFHFEHLVAAYAQPEELDIFILGERHTWTPDGLIVEDDGTETLIEVKPLEFVQPDEEQVLGLKEQNEMRVEAMNVAAALTGRKFMLITEDDARLEPRFHNAKMMFRAHGANITDAIVQEGIMALRILPKQATVRELSAALPRYNSAGLMIACILDRRGYIRLDRRDFFSARCRFENNLIAGGSKLVEVTT